MKGIKRIRPGLYHVRVTKVCPRTGRRYNRRAKVSGSRRDALDRRAELLAELDDEICGRRRVQPTLTDYAQQWLRRRADRLKPSTLAKYVNDLEQHILPALGHVLIAELRPGDVADFLATDPGAPNSRKNRLALLRAMAKDAQADDLTERDFCARVTVKVPPVYSDDEPNLLTTEQLEALLAAIPQNWLDLACVLTYTGLRWGEVAALHWDDLDLASGAARIRWTLWKGILQSPKSDAADRTVPLVAPLPAMLAARRERMLMEGHPGLASGLVFPTQAGRPHRGTPLGPVLRAACERVEIGIRFTPHGLRRTWNNLARRVADGMVVRAMIGHADEAMTEHYSRVGVEEKRTAARAVADLFQAPVERQNVSQDVSRADSEPAGAPSEPPDED